MRWMWIDRFVELEPGKRAKSIKCVSMAEEHLHDHFPGFPLMPHSLIIEGLAQTGGILLGQVNDFRHLVVLAKVPRMTFHSWAVPGDTLSYETELVDVRDEGGMVEARAKVGDRLVAEGQIMFAHADAGPGTAGAIDQKSAVFTLLLGVLQVGKANAEALPAPA